MFDNEHKLNENQKVDKIEKVSKKLLFQKLPTFDFGFQITLFWILTISILYKPSG